jgi:putative SOS response-associated peptidase YedK
MINARVETVAERPAFKRAFERFRCLIIADGFFEWDRAKQAFHITRSDQQPFAFAGLWSIWRSGDDEDQVVRSCTIITTAANATVRALHDRMPVILRADVESDWLDPSIPGKRHLELLRPLPDVQTALRPVGPAVNDAHYDGPECLAAPLPAPTLF